MTSRYTCFVFDSDMLFIRALETIANELDLPFSFFVFNKNDDSVIEQVLSDVPDLVFIDIIRFEGPSGKFLDARTCPDSEIIFTAEASGPAMRIANMATTGFLVKPVNKEALLYAIDNALGKIRLKKSIKDNTPIGATRDKRIGIQNSRGIDFINIDDIIYLEAMNKYTRITTHKLNLLNAQCLNKFEPLIVDSNFLKVHRSFIVNLKCVDRYEASGLITLCNKTQVPVARSERKNLLNRFSIMDVSESILLRQ